MIDFSKEHLIPLRDVPRHLPPRPHGGRLHVSACYRWVLRGLRGVVLESIRIGGATYTSIEALQRFGDALSGSRLVEHDNHPLGSLTRRRQVERAHDAALRELGISEQQK
ncbi:MAG: DUF1580 domain-containing protein [Nitrospira sp. CR1.3]|nr:DUF1580 domain-containing protein [Nitrospira sp. CR1.3]